MMQQTDTPLSEATRNLDITSDVCPMTFVRTRLALDDMEAGQTLAVRLMEGMPLRNVKRSAGALGHEIVTQTDNGDGTFTLLIRKCRAPT